MTSPMRFQGDLRRTFQDMRPQSQRHVGRSQQPPPGLIQRDVELNVRKERHAVIQ
eukprot:CAMPEP_0198130936 /NCGR_PEP_ID=MMETSP1442-20131203/55029_1 /TAXON_ID= /ORGANISM="Craspedostauros australis, Strain CCMP3328" /LENGTH=54 /DNA_ID=CAMNT_0043791653 /DNA_START=188 /DNA_END=349 /DNA_ORIENTATION=+